MLHTVLNLTRPLVVFDTETTGTGDSSRIIQIAFKLYTGEGLQLEWKSLVNPEIPVPESTTSVHGIRDVDFQTCRVCRKFPVPLGMDPKDGGDDYYCTCEVFKPVPTFAQIAPNLARGFKDCDYAGKNIRFDLRILSSEMARVRVPWTYQGARVVDIDRLEQLAQPRTLSALYKKYLGKELEDAHDAMADVAGSVEVMVAQLEQHAEILPRNLDELHELQWPGWLTSNGQFRIKNGVPTCCFGNKYRDVAMREIPASYWDWILRNDFPEDVKALARDAKRGVYPGAPVEAGAL